MPFSIAFIPGTAQNATVINDAFSAKESQSWTGQNLLFVFTDPYNILRVSVKWRPNVEAQRWCVVEPIHVHCGSSATVLRQSGSSPN